MNSAIYKKKCVLLFQLNLKTLVKTGSRTQSTLSLRQALEPTELTRVDDEYTPHIFLYLPILYLIFLEETKYNLGLSVNKYCVKYYLDDIMPKIC